MAPFGLPGVGESDSLLAMKQSPSRRSFLKMLAAGTTAAVVPQPGFSQAETRSPRPPQTRVGFLGVSHSHAAEKLKVVQENPAFDLVGVHEPDETIVRRFAAAEVPFLSQEELLQRAEAVVIESAVQDHARHAKTALTAGKHVHVEKPPAATLDGLRELVALAREHKRLLQVGYMWRFHPGLTAAIAAAHKGWLGDIYLVRATMNTLLDTSRRPEWGQFPGGAMFELGCHLIDALVRLLGRPDKVTPFLKSHGRQDDLADNCVAVFEFGRALAIITTTTLQPNAGPQRFLEILGTNGTALLKPIEPPGLQIDLVKSAGPYKAGSQKVEMPPYRRYVGEFAELADAIRLAKPLSVTLEHELTVQDTLARACKKA